MPQNSTFGGAFPFLALFMLWQAEITPALLDHPDLTESSGVAAGGRDSSIRWTHNDSGDSPRLFAFNKDGSLLSVAVSSDVKARDWEDMCAFERSGEHYLAVGDVGDNLFRRESVQVHIFVEPKIAEPPDSTQPGEPVPKTSLRRVLTLEITYEYGPANCEGIAYDPLRDAIVLATKESLRCRLYEVPLTTLPNSQKMPAVRQVRAKQTQAFVLPLVTGLDISRAGTEIVFCTYGPGIFLTRDNKSKPWSHELGFERATFPLPPRKQGEAICFTGDGSRILLTSEFAPCPLFEIDAPRAVANPAPDTEPEN
jgi:hypothetical protein